MAVTPEEVRHVASLARLRLEPEEVEQMTRELNGILTHVDELESADVEGAGGGVEPGYRAPLRADDPAPDPLAYGPDALAPEWRGGFFAVPRLASHEDDDLSVDEGRERSP